MVDKLKYWYKFVLLYKNWVELILNRLTRNNSTNIKLRNNFVISSSHDSPLSVVMDETFILERYTQLFKIKKEDVVVDIGAHIGDFSIYAAIKGAKQIFAFEPDPTSYLDLKNNVSVNNISNIIPKNMAVSGKDGYANFYTNKINGGNSLIHFENNSKTIRVKTISINSILNVCGIKNIDFLKIDCEGGEGLIIDAASKSTWRSIERIALEYHDNVSSIHHLKIKDIFNKLGYSVSIKSFGRKFGYIYAARQ